MDDATPDGPTMPLPEAGPGLAARATGIEPVSTVAAVFAVLCLIPTAWFGRGFGVEAFGPIAFPVILAIVAVLFGLLSVLRHAEVRNPAALRLGISALAVALVRVFIYPMAGW